MDLSQKRVSFIRFYVLFLLVYFLVFIGNGLSVRSCSFACTGDFEKYCLGHFKKRVSFI